MNFKRMMGRYMEQAGEPAPGGAPAAPATPPAGATTPAAPATPAPSLLAGGAAPAEPGAFDFIPEKLRVNKDDGAFDLEASSRKMGEAYSALEKRFGAGDVPPKTAAEYTVSVPDAFKEAIDPATDVGMKGFLDGALEQGMTQKQVDFVMSKYFDMAPKLVEGGMQYDATTAAAELGKAWNNEADMKRGVRNAFVGASAAANKAGMDINAIMSGPLGNNPDFVRLMAALGPEFQEDPGVGGMQMVTQDDINSLLSSDAYKNPQHADHAKTSAKVRAYYERKHGTAPAG